MRPGSRLRLASLRPSDLPPIYPAMVMGTGSLSSGALLLGMPVLSAILYVIAGCSFTLLCVLTGIRLARHPDLVRADARQPKTAFAPFTIPAAVAVLGVRAAITGHVVIPAVALVLASAATVGLAIPAIRMARSEAGRWGAVTGNWQLPSVAIEAMALLAATIGGRTRDGAWGGVGVLLWAIGIPAYGVVVPLIVRRFRRIPWKPDDLTPDYWTFMAVPSLIGLVAIRLSVVRSGLASTGWLQPAYRPLAVAGLGASAVLAPAWIGLQVWRLVRDPASRRYRPAWWGVVFPTAVVVLHAQVMAVAYDLRWLHFLALTGYWVVLGVWATVATGLIRDLFRPGPVERTATTPTHRGVRGRFP